MKFFAYILLIVLLACSINCQSYHKPISLSDSAKVGETGKKFKVTLYNGDEIIYDSIILHNNNYYGVNIENGERTSVLINENSISKIEQYHKTKGSFMNVFGILIGGASLALAVIMLN